MAEPLRMISGYLDLIRESYGSQLDADFEDFIALAIDGADRMLAYLESLRTYSRIGWLEGERERVELRHLVDEALTRLAPRPRRGTWATPPTARRATGPTRWPSTTLSSAPPANGRPATPRTATSTSISTIRSRPG